LVIGWSLSQLPSGERQDTSWTGCQSITAGILSWEHLLHVVYWFPGNLGVSGAPGGHWSKSGNIPDHYPLIKTHLFVSLIDKAHCQLLPMHRAKPFPLLLQFFDADLTHSWLQLQLHLTHMAAV